VKVKMKTLKHSRYLLSVLKKFLLYLKTGSWWEKVLLR